MENSVITYPITNAENYTNVGNIRYTGIKWQGLIGQNIKGFCVFASKEYGIRAMSKILFNDIFDKKDRRDTIRLILMEYAPMNENNTLNYISTISQKTGYSPDMPITSPNQLIEIQHQMIKVEKGYYIDKQLIKEQVYNLWQPSETEQFDDQLSKYLPLAFGGLLFGGLWVMTKGVWR